MRKLREFRNSTIWVPMRGEDLGAFLAYKYGAKFNYYIFVGGINVLAFAFFIVVCGLTYLFTYKPTLIDPIQELKKYLLFFEKGHIIYEIL